jgi:aminopeptidase N
MDEEQPAPRKRLGAVGIRELAMIFDSGPHSRPVRVAMTSRKDLRGVYHRIVYDKGAAILLMLDGWLGEDRIREGLRTYLREHRFGNATTVDLAAALRKASGIDVTPVLNTFLDQTGVPTVQAAVRCDSKPRLEISQVNSTGQWAIPVCWKAGTAGSGCTVLDAPKREIELPACPSWTYLNSGGTGYYRTGGSPAQLAALADSGLGQLTAPERLTLVYDLRALKRAGRADVSHLLGTLASDPEPEIARAASLALQPK